ncbi:hypothetical protein CDAR_544521 [Caerostris darwini]|uniref:Uncharacterized protein n=1 Tax=Caerostris darwini TaxID=1538125 RepID=A0AAV4QEP6_9ARAC|nr:hypothetical protein CDAR_544521 [Caerostris darwini]
MKEELPVVAKFPVPYLTSMKALILPSVSEVFFHRRGTGHGLSLNGHKFGREPKSAPNSSIDARTSMESYVEEKWVEVLLEMNHCAGSKIIIMSSMKLWMEMFIFPKPNFQSS